MHNVGCRERKDIGTVRGASYYKATMIGGGGGDRHVSNMAIGWIGYDGKVDSERDQGWVSCLLGRRQTCMLLP